MGFWDVTKRVLMGKPGFVEPAADDGWDDDAPTTDFAEERQAKREVTQKGTGTRDGLVDEKGYKHPPVVELTNVKSDISGDTVDFWVTIKNQSARDVLLDKLTLLGAKNRLNYPLGAGDQRVFRAYSGPKPQHDHYKRCELYYKDEATGDYFRVDHLVQYQYESDGTYDVVDFERIDPIYDV